MEDADLSAASDAAVFARFQNCGQSCIAAKRIFVHSAIYDDFLSLFKDKVNKIRIGDPYDPDTFIGPMVTVKALDILDTQIEKSVALGTEVVTGGTRFTNDKPVFRPTVLVNVSEKSPVLNEETFGPVIPVMKYDNIEELIKAVNKTEYGLGASIWTRNREQGLHLASSIDSGAVTINGFVRSDPALPFGGVKNSGYGRELSDEGFREFLNIKTVTVFH
jgi:succinate-semialdehyde dehydrogenase/glutarate-semialdehyde dehydrogenase